MYLEVFFKEVHDEDKGDILGFPNKPENKMILTKTLTKIIW